MRVVLQRVSTAAVLVDGQVTGEIGRGLLVLLGVGKEDREADADWLTAKLVQLRIFPDDAGKMNLSLADIGGEILVVSQFTLLGDCGRGRRPGFDAAAPAESARRLYEYFVDRLRSSGLKVETGIFQADMQVSLTNSGPVTLIVDSPAPK